MKNSKKINKLVGQNIESRLLGLEIVRSIAILTVLFYHLNLSGFFNAGFLGVDIFFNLSGFLITCLLLKEYEKSGRIQLGTFYLRRFKRLFPAAAAMILACLIFSPIFMPQAFLSLCKDIPAALLYYSNWWQIYSKQPYFETFDSPPLLQHLWSLAVEEQFYILWPIALITLLKFMHVRKVGWVALLLAVCSTVWMACLDGMRINGVDSSRAYLGSDAHSMGLFLGAALACFWNPWQERSPQLIALVEKFRIPICSMAFMALFALVTTWNEGLSFLFNGGFFLSGLITLVLIFSLTDLKTNSWDLTLWGQLFVRCITWIGTRSYAIYLWHWPIFIAFKVQPDMTWVTIFFSLAVTFILSECSYRIIEQPFKSIPLRSAISTTQFALVSTLTCVSMGISWIAFKPLEIIEKTKLVQQFNAASIFAESSKKNVSFSATDSLSMTEKPVDSSQSTQKMILVGDSVLLGAKDYMLRNFSTVTVDAEVGRQAHQGLQVIKKIRSLQNDIDFAVIHLGTNGYIVESQYVSLLKELSDLQKVIVFNVYANRRWTQPNNEIIDRVTQFFPNVSLVNWNEMGQTNPQFFVKDGIHLTSDGILAMTQEISKISGIALSSKISYKPAKVRTTPINEVKVKKVPIAPNSDEEPEGDRQDNPADKDPALNKQVANNPFD